MCAICEQFDWYIDRLNVPKDMSVTLEPDEVGPLRELLQDDKQLWAETKHPRL